MIVGIAGDTTSFSIAVTVIATIARASPSAVPLRQTSLLRVFQRHRSTRQLDSFYPCFLIGLNGAGSRPLAACNSYARLDTKGMRN